MHYMVGIFCDMFLGKNLQTMFFAVKEDFEKTKENNFSENGIFWKIFLVKNYCGCFAENSYLCLG